MENRVVLVTGGASGIGKGMVRMFADRGCQVIIFDVQDDKGETLAKELCDQGKKVVYKHVNLFDIDKNNERKWFWAYCQYDIWCWIIRNQRKLSLLCS